jgi:membrane associated rhomboid family serine protease
MLVLLNGLAFYYEVQMGNANLSRFFQDWGLVPAKLSLDSAETWLRIYSSMFLHGGWIHILGNMWVLIIFGDNVEDRMGRAPFLIFYLLCGTVAALMQTYLSPASTMPIIGASGAIAGVLGAYLILFPRARITSFVPIFFLFTLVEVPAVIFLGFWFILQLFSGWLALQGADMSGVAWWAHVGGFLFGMFTARLFVRR